MMRIGIKHPPSSHSTVFLFSILLVLTWGALAFGAEYSWAYAPLLVLSVMSGVLGLCASRGLRVAFRLVALPLAAIFVAGAIQLVPLPRRAIAAMSPALTAVNYDRLYDTATMRPALVATMGDVTTHALSIAPSRTVLGLAFVAAFGIFLLGSVRGISAVGARPIARGTLVLGVLVALLEVMHKASGSYLEYGFWYAPPSKGVTSAPFINRNHTAGWLLMALGLSAGHFAGVVADGFSRVKHDFRHRFLWLSSRDASEAVLTGFALAVMVIGIVATSSRSGFLCLVASIVVFGAWVINRQASKWRRASGAAYLLFLLFAGATWGGVDAVIARFHVSEPDLGGRLAIWQDTFRIIRDFPVAGTGLNTYGIAMLHYQTVKAPGGELFIEAHND